MKHLKHMAIILALILTSTTFLSVSAADASTWQLMDGSFESWGKNGQSDFWSMYRSGEGVVETVAGRTGQAVRLSDEAGSRICLYQNIGTVPRNTILSISAWIKIEKCTAGNGLRILARYGSLDGTAGKFTDFITSTDGEWMQLTLTETVTNDLPLYLHIDMNSVEGFSVLVDDVVVEEGDPEIKNPRFDNIDSADDKKFEGWANALSTGQKASVIHTDEETNSQVVYLTEQGYVSQSIKVTPGKTYRFSFDYKSDGVGAMVKLESGNEVPKSFESTNGKWARRYIDITTGAATTNMNILLRYVTGEGTAATYVCYDNVSIERVGDNELLPNGSFDYGSFSWTAEGTAELTEVAEGYSGKALTVTADSGTNGSIYYNLSSLPARTETLYYELTCFVKVTSSNTTVHIGTENYYGSNTRGNWGFFTALPANKWVKLSQIIPFNTDETRAILKLRVIGGGTATFDSATLHPFNEPSIIFSNSNGTYTEKIENGLQAQVLIPTSAAATFTGILAIYENSTDGICLKDFRIAEMTPASGFGKITLSSGNISDFETGDYFAKLILVDGAATLSPLYDAVILTK